jgi:4-hydroxy-tetrahydrodipicolinate synthase
MGSTRFRGTGTALVTPFGHDGVDRPALARLVERQIGAGVDFLVPCGTTGESPTLTDDERVAVIETVVETAAGRVPVVAGTGTNDTPHSVAMTRAARQAGADACLAVAPYYNKPTQEGLYRHFRAMIDEGGLPAMLYHIVGRTGISIEPETIARTAAAGGVVGLKETETVARVTRIRELCDVPILSGDDGLTLPMMALGAVGVVSVASNVVPERVSGLVRAMAGGRLSEALRVHEELSPLFRALFLEPNPIPVKAALAMLGAIPCDAVRLPLVEASGGVRQALGRALEPLAERTLTGWDRQG